MYNNQQAAHDNNTKDQANNETTDKDASKDKKAKDERTVADWTVLKTAQYTSPMPDGWKLQNAITDIENTEKKEKIHVVTEETFMKRSHLDYEKGSPAKIKTIHTTARGATEPENSLLRMIYSDDVLSKIKEFKQHSDDVTETRTENGDMLHATVTTYEEDTPTIMMKIRKGTHYYSLVVQKNSSKAGVIIRYMVEPEMTDYSAQLQKGLMKLKFL